MINIDDSYLEDEIRDGFYIPSMTKRTWAMELTVLDLIDEICKKHDIKYFADWGTYLGALRHAGFVPWDDDMDICMHRNEFEKFMKVADKELPDGYSVMSFHNNDYSWKFIYNIVPNDHMCFEPEYLKSHYSFPYIVAIDIFIIDNISDNAEEEHARSAKIKALLNEADQIITNKNEADKEDTEKKRAIYSEAEKLLKIENENDTKRVVQKIPWGVYNGRSFLKDDFSETVRIPFEMTSVPVPLCYNHVLHEKYGDFMKIVLGGGGHDYPYYAGQKRALGEEFDYPRLYKFSEADILGCEKDFSASLKTISSDMKEYLTDSVEILNEVADSNNYTKEDVLSYLADLQQNVVNFGTLIESVKGEETKTVKGLEDYCEQLFNVAEKINSDSYTKTAIGDLSNIVLRVSENIDLEIINRRSVLFLPVKAKYWESLELFYENEIIDVNTDVYVMPLPYFYKEYDGSFKEEINYEIAAFNDKGIKTCRYDQFDISLLCPDCIYINMPYDEYNMTMSVPNIFYARNIKKYTQKLVYVPFFKSMEFDKSNYPCWHNMQYYCSVPGVVVADEVNLQSDKTKAIYIEKLNEWAGSDKYSEIWNKKFIVIKTEESKEDKLCEQLDNNNCKKTLVWYISAGTVIEYGDKYFEKAYHNMDVFLSNHEKISVLLITDSFADSVLKQHAPDLYAKWCNFVKYFKEKNIGSFANDSANDLDELREKAILCNAYYGDPSVICKDFYIAKKPVMLQNVDCI